MSDSKKYLPTPEALELLQSAEVPHVDKFVVNVARRAYPDKIFASTATGDNVAKRLEEAVQDYLNRHPEVAARLKNDENFNQSYKKYQQDLTDNLIKLREEKKLNYDVYTEQNAGIGGTYLSEKSEVVAPFLKMNLNIHALNLGGTHGCQTCHKQHSSPVCDSQIVVANRQEFEDIYGTESYQRMAAAYTGLHELGHAQTLPHLNTLGMGLKRMVSGANGANVMENAADSFATLSLIREFGDVGAAYIHSNILSETLPQILKDSIHYTLKTRAETYQWAMAHRDELQAMPYAKMDKMAADIGQSNALSNRDERDMNLYQKTWMHGSYADALDSAVVQEYKALGQNLLGAEGERSIGLAGLEMSRRLVDLVDAKLVNCPAPTAKIKNTPNL